MIFRLKTQADPRPRNDHGSRSPIGSTIDDYAYDNFSAVKVDDSAPIQPSSGKAVSDSAGTAINELNQGVNKPSSPDPSPEEVRYAVAFARISSVLMRSPRYKHYTLADLEWLIVPPIVLGQCVTMDSNAKGRSTPVAAAFWALVSEDVDRKLLETNTVPIRLRPDEWRSGNIVWLIDIVGENRALPTFVRHLQNEVFIGRHVKMETHKQD